MKNFNMNNLDINKIKKIIIITVIIILITIALLVIFNLLKNNGYIPSKGEIIDEEEVGTPPIDSQEKHKIDSASTFFSIEDAIQKYLNSISINVNEIASTPIRGSNMRSAATIYAENNGITDEQSKKQSIYNFLSKRYIQSNDITVDNVMEKIPNNEKVEFEALDMLRVLDYEKEQYAVYGIETNLNDRSEKEVYFVVDVDKYTDDGLFAITPIVTNEYKKLEDIPLNINDISIEKNNNNIFPYSTITDKELTLKYFSYYKSLMLKDPEKAYEMLDEEYKNKRFENLETFRSYIDKNREDIENYVAREYGVNKLTDGTEYICQDQYNHAYMFKETSVMEFSAKLDNYTIESEETKQKYQEAKEQKKVAMNIDKWITMLNSKDYKAAFEVLDETFRNQYFENVDDFEEYMKNTFPAYMGVELMEYSKESGVNIQKVILYDSTGDENWSKPETIIMQLSDEGFKMSFRILNH